MYKNIDYISTGPSKPASLPINICHCYFYRRKPLYTTTTNKSGVKYIASAVLIRYRWLFPSQQ